MLAWLGGLAGALLQHAGEGGKGFNVSMAMTPRFDHPGFIVSPAGPRDETWLRATEKDPRTGIDLFPWWDEGRTARVDLARALCHLWLDVPWRGAVDDDEERKLSRIEALLARAYAADPSLAYPWSAWADLLEDLGRTDEAKSVRARATETSSDEPIGYRRYDAHHTLTGGWSLRVPGAFTGSFDEKGTWCATDGTRTIWFTSMSFASKSSAEKPSMAKVLARSKRSGEPVALAGLPAGYAFIADIRRQEPEDEEPYWTMSVEVGVEEHLAALTIVYYSREDERSRRGSPRRCGAGGSELRGRCSRSLTSERVRIEGERGADR
jgi:hypothetical protein